MSKPTPTDKQTPKQPLKRTIKHKTGGASIKTNTLPRLTYKQKAFVKHIIDNPKQSATQAAKAVYNTTSYGTQRQIATDNLAKPSIIMALANHNNLVEQTILNTIDDFKDSDKQWERTLATDTARYVHDKIHGKATQRIEQTTTGITFNIDMTGNSNNE